MYSQDIASCIYVNQLPSDAVFGADYGQTGGDTIFRTDGLTLTIDSFYFSDRSAALGTLQVIKEDQSADVRPSIWSNNANLTLIDEVNSNYSKIACFNFIYEGGALNVGADGQVFFFANLDDLLSESSLLPDLNLNIDIFQDDSTFVSGRICLEGVFDAATIGGQDMLISNLCITQGENNRCPWNDVIINPLKCTSEGYAIFDIDFPVDWNVRTSSYFLEIEGTPYGPFAYDQNDITVGPIEINDANLYEVFVFDTTNTNCSYKTTVSLTCPSYPCPVTDIEVYIDDCEDEEVGTNLVINFDYDSELARWFFLEIGGLVRDSFSTDQLPLNLRVPFDIPETIPVEVNLCFEKDQYDTPCCFNFQLSRKDCKPDNACLTFDDMETGKRFGRENYTPGTLIFTESEVPVTIHPFLLRDSIFEYLYTEVRSKENNDYFEYASDNFLFLVNSNLTFDFSPSQLPSKQVCLDFYEGGGLINFGLNGKPVQVINTINDVLRMELPDGITASMFDGDNDSRQETICFSGDIQQLTIGGQELGIDNLCFGKVEDSCEIKDFTATSTTCDAEGSFFVDLHLNPVGSASDSFYVYHDIGELLGTFSYRDDSVRVGPFNAYSRDLLYLIVQDKEAEDCSAKILVDKPTNCHNQCELGDLEVDLINCYDQTFYDLLISIDYFPDTYADRKFNLIIERKDYGTYSFSDLPLTINRVNILTEATFFPVALCLKPITNDEDECCIDFNVNKQDCEPNCHLTPIDIVEKECTAEGALFVTIDFEYENTSKYFELVRNGMPIGRYAYEELPIKVGPLYPTGTDRPVTLAVYDTRQDDCSSSLIIEDFPCTSLPCELGEIKVLQTFCESKVFLLIDFDHARTSGTFQAILDDEELGIYSYQDLPIIIGPWDASKDANLVIKDTEFKECLTSRKLNAFNCEPKLCTLGDINIEKTYCGDDGNPYILLDVRYEGNADSFKLVQDTQLIGTYAYQELPLHVALNAFTPESNTFKLTINDQLHDNCFTSETFEVFRCPSDTCSLGDIKILDRYCSDTGADIAKIDFTYQAVSDSFWVEIDGQSLPLFGYDQLPITIKLPADPADLQHSINVYDSKSDLCFTSTQIDTVKCPKPLCNLDNIVITEQGCADSGKPYIVINFDYQSTSDSFYLNTYNEFVESYAYENLPIRIEFDNNSSIDVVPIKVTDHKNEDCSVDTRVELSPCNLGDCSISGLDVIEKKCDEGKLFLTISFDYERVSESFILLQNGNEIGTYKYSELPIKVGPFDPATAGDSLDLSVMDVENQDCSTNLRLPDLSCPNDCSIGDLSLYESPCEEDGTYYVNLNFRHEMTSEGFLLILNDQEEGRFRYDDLPIRLGPFFSPGQETLFVQVKDLENPNCYQEKRFRTEQCLPEKCLLAKVETDNIECNNDTSYNITLAYRGEGIYDNDVIVATFSSGYQFRFLASSNPVRISNVPLPDTRRDLVTLCVANREDCCLTTDFEIPCRNTCGLTNLQVQVTKCSEDGRFGILVTSDYKEVSDGFTLFLNGRAYGNYLYEELPLEIKDLTAEPGESYQVTIRDFSNFDCKASARFVAPDCAYRCGLHSVQVEIDDCQDGSFKAFILTESKNDQKGEFIVFLGGDLYGPYPYGTSEIELGPFPTTGDRYDVLVIDSDDPTCFVATEFYAPEDCDDVPNDCAIKNLDIKVIDCIDDGIYRISVDFEARNPGNYFFNLIGPNGEVFESYQLDALPLKTNIRLEGDTAVTLGVCINDRPDCCQRTTIDLTNCGSQSDCFLDRVQVKTTECDDNGDVYILLEAGLEANSNKALEVIINDQIIDSVRFDGNDPVRVGPISPELGQEIYLLLTSLTTDNCFREIALTFPTCGDDSDVWPGDANRDNIANYFDLINVGVAYGARGLSRTSRETDWINIPGSAWNQFFTTGLNFKHADCNGDGVIDARDIGIILRNYNRTNGPEKAPDTLPLTDLDPPIQLDLPPGGHIGSSDPRFSIPIILGSSDRPVNDLYGLAFVIEFDPT
ncbi:MAG: hypothetical protein HRU40_01725, partial [Saprospiraceae bacterium]|nr:hypothetical protein [Saprospiraceae bacterium]